MENYKCPLCHEEIERDLVVFRNHTDKHILEEIKKGHPEWVESDGVCRQCVEYFRAQISGK